MNKRELFKKVIDDNTMSKNDNKIVIMDKIHKQKNPFNIKRFSKYAVAAVIVLAVFCSPLIGSVMNNMGIFGEKENNSGNWFSLVAYAAEGNTFEIPKDMGILLPAGTWNIGKLDEGISIGWKAAFNKDGEAIPGGFGIEGENIKSVYLESENATFKNTLFMRDDLELVEIFVNFKETDVYLINHVYLEGEDISLMHCFAWFPDKYVSSQIEENYHDYLTDKITVRVTFDDGEIITQYVKITIDEETGEMFAQIIE